MVTLRLDLLDSIPFCRGKKSQHPACELALRAGLGLVMEELHKS